MNAVITIDHLHKTYGSQVAVEDISFSVQEGEIFGIIGPNGAGKTTTVECLQGLRHPDSGTMQVLGLDPRTRAQQLRHHIGSQLQESALPDRLKVAEALDLMAAFSAHPLPRERLLEQWGLTEQANSAFGNLSGGQRQRLFIALAFVNDPTLVFLDELTQGLDPQARRVTWDLVREIREQGKTVVLVTHFMDEAELLCDRVAIIDHGRVVALNTPHGLIEQVGVPSRVLFTAGGVELPDLSAVSGVTQVERKGPRVEVQGTGPVLALVANALVEHGILPVDLRVERPTLEDAFISLTGRTIRE